MFTTAKHNHCNRRQHVRHKNTHETNNDSCCWTPSKEHAITCRAFVLMTRSITSPQDVLGMSFYGREVAIFNVTSLPAAQVQNVGHFFTDMTQYYMYM